MKPQPQNNNPESDLVAVYLDREKTKRNYKSICEIKKQVTNPLTR